MRRVLLPSNPNLEHLKKQAKDFLSRKDRDDIKEAVAEIGAESKLYFLDAAIA